MSTQVEEGDKVNWAWGGSNPSGTAAEVKPGEVTVVSHRGNEISKTGTEDNPAVHIERSGNDVVKLADELNVTKKAEAETNGSSSNGTSATEKKEEQKEEESASKEPEDAHAGDKRKASETAESTEKPSEEDDVDDGTEDTKKLKVANGKAAPAPKEKTPAPAAKKEKTPAPKKEKTPAPPAKEKAPAPAKKEKTPAASADATEKKDDDAPVEKKKAGRPPKSAASTTGPKKEKKEKKVPAVGQAQRKTRSQGVAPEEGL